MQDYTLGFDELHIIDTKQNDSGGAGGGGAGQPVYQFVIINS